MLLLLYSKPFVRLQVRDILVHPTSADIVAAAFATFRCGDSSVVVTHDRCNIPLALSNNCYTVTILVPITYTHYAVPHHYTDLT